MADVTLHHKVTETLVEVELRLSPAEAITLKEILALVGGDPELSARCFTDRIHEALENAGVPYATGNTNGDRPDNQLSPTNMNLHHFLTGAVGFDNDSWKNVVNAARQWAKK